MKRRNTYPYIWFFATLLVLMSLPSPFTDRLRSNAIKLAAPLWEKLLRPADESTVLQQQLQLENDLLRRELVHAEELLRETVSWNRVFKLEATSQRERTKQQAEALPARVIYRASSTWNSTLWVDVGEEQNGPEGVVVAKNSPVVVGNSLVGVIDYVGKKQSRVCLLTNASLVPSVRVARGGLAQKLLAENIAHLADRIADIADLFTTAKERDDFFGTLERIQQALYDKQAPSQTLFLAKGELHGNSAPLWRSAGSLLKGIGFNYDYADEAGPARDLRRGTPYGSPQNTPSTALLQLQDLLVTTGLDGIFPPDLNVAEIVHVSPLKEGDYYYEILARPTAANLDELNLVFILPPIGYNAEELPPL